MNVFVLNTGRCGSMTLAAACSHITNFTSAHESNWGCVGPSRLEYPKNHIEIDNRMAWFLGELHDRYGDDAYYVHLTRDPHAVAKSFTNRWDQSISIVRAFGHDILAAEGQTIEIAQAYVTCVTANIEFFLRDKPHVMRMSLEGMADEFPCFWEWIGAEGQYDLALGSIREVHNATEQKLPTRPPSIGNRVWKKVARISDRMKAIACPKTF